MKLLKLTLTNFKGVRNFTFEPDGQSVSVYGQNETGKTTIADALTYLLFDKDTSGQTPDNFGIKTRENGEVVHGIDHVVWGVFDTVTLKKVYKEKWTKARGSANKELTGHTTDYYVDNVPVKMKEYQETVAGIMPEETFRMLTTPSYFPEQLHWKERRKVLFDIAGTISTDDIINSNPGLSRYPEILDGKTEDKTVEMLKSRKKELNRELDQLPVRIDEANRSIVETGDATEAKAEIEKLKKKRSALEAKKSEVEAGGNVADLKVKKQEIEAEKNRLTNEHQQKLDDSLADLRAKISELESRQDAISNELSKERSNYSSANDELKNLKGEVERVEKEIETTQAKEPTPDEAGECPYCNNPLGIKVHRTDDGYRVEQIKDDHEKYVADFNQQKAEDLKRLNAELTEAKEKVSAKETEFETVKQKGLKLDGQKKQVESAITQKKAELEDKKKSVTPVTETDEYKKLVSEQEGIQAKIDNHLTEKQNQVNQLNGSITALNAEIEKHEQTLLQAQQNERTKKRIDELNAERKRLADELEQTEADLNLIDDFIRVRARLVTERVNDRFEKVKWELFREQLNGGLEEICMPTFKGVPYSAGLNNAGRIQAGLDIINTLSNHYDKSAPLVIDNAEAVVDIPDYGLQLIKLYVSEKDTSLRVEVEQKKMKKAG